MDIKNKAQMKWPTILATAIVFISILIIQIGPNLSKSNSQESIIVSNFIEKMPQIEAMMADSSGSSSQVSTISSNSMDQIPRIEAIGISGSGESCISIAGKYVHKGDIINGFRIYKIYADKVEFEKNGNIIAATFPQTSTEVKVNNQL